MSLIRRLAVGLLVVGAAAGALVAGTAASQAAAPETKTVTWYVPAGLGDRFAEPQLLVADTSACGQYQVDVYNYATRADKTIVDGLLASGKLTGVADDTTVFRSGHDVVTTDCTAAGRSGPAAITVSAGDPGSGGDSSVGGAGTSGTASSSDDPGGLAFTGSDARTLELAGGAAVVLVGAGVVLLAARRQRSR